MSRLFSLTMAAICALVPVASSAGGSSSFQPAYMQTQNPIVPGETWEWLKEEVAGDVALVDGEDLVSFDAPPRAFDAATVPFTVTQRSGTGVRITHMAIVVDENPMPIAAEFDFGPLMGDIAIEGRVRYDVYSNIRAVLTGDDGQIYMVGRFVEAAGGCSAAVSKDVAVAEASMGQMRLKQIDTSGGVEMSSAPKEAQLMIRHPNFTGMQVHEGTMNTIDPRYVDFVEVMLGDEMLFTMTGGFSISENPTFRFNYRDNGAGLMTVRARDSDGTTFSQTFVLNSGA
ncbi:MAG: quinoprotein dehydrogenase-associated SoxYZ-like carrier [Sulfitobacter sp.]|jgi:sulfur-oxidizing protein SoxY|nr:quinoprotein dehydrogenase-associated SoxYZ-like carrier [Sulfitobacter sp.]